MAIRFHCPACSQPIEVDDEWAGRAVACPYCRKTVTAPSQSTLGDLSTIPTATPVGFAGAVPPAPYAYAPSSNPLAVVALVLASVTVGLFLTSAVIGSRHSLEFAEIQREMTASDKDASPMKAAMEYTRKHGGTLPGWLMAISFLSFGGMVTCVSGLICGLIALRHAARRALAIISVVACGGVIAWLGLGLLVGLAQIG